MVLGSFTGIRIGLATIKGFADSLDIACIGIDSLLSLSYNIKTPGYIASIIYSNNDICYYSLNHLDENGNYTSILEPNLDNIENIISKINNYIENKKLNSNFSITFIGDAAIDFKDVIQDTFPDSLFSSAKENVFNSYNLGLAGLDKYNLTGSEDVLPLYIKKPQAQIELELKNKEIK